MSTVPELFHWLSGHSQLGLANLDDQGFTVASMTPDSTRVVRFAVNDDVLTTAQPVLAAQSRDSMSARAEGGVEPAWGMLDTYLHEAIEMMPSQVSTLTLTREGSLQMSA